MKMVLNLTSNNYTFNNSRGSKANTMSYLGTLSPEASSVDSNDVTMNSPQSASLSPGTQIYDTYQYVNIDSVFGDVAGPYLEILEQPTEKFRFRYKSEMAGTHGSLTGANSDKIRKNTYPTVQLHNCQVPAIIRCSLYQAKNDEPHPHRLVVRGSSDKEIDDPHSIHVSPEKGYKATFLGMGIIHTAKKNLASELYKKKLKQFKEELVRKGLFRDLLCKEDVELKAKAEMESKIINLNTVRLGFEAFFESENGVLLPLCDPVFSHGINNLKSALTGELKIDRMSVTTVPCNGGQDVYILVEKVTKNNIQVRFFECDDDDNEVWSAYGKFFPTDVHHQYAIVLKAPPYREQNIESTVQVFIELVRPSDGARSEPRIFKYKPCEKVGGKRRYTESLPSSELPIMLQEFSSFNSGSLSSLDPDFFKHAENVHSEDFEKILMDVLPDYEKIYKDNSFGNLTTDGPSSTSIREERVHEIDQETETLAKQILFELKSAVQSALPSAQMEKLVNYLFIKFQTKEGNTALQASLLCEQFQNFQYIIVLLSKMKNLKIVDIQNNDGETALHIAVKIENPTVINVLLCVDADPNIADKKGNTPLHVAVEKNLPIHLAGYKNLVESTKKDIENDESHTPLSIAVMKNNLQSVKTLVNINANVNHIHLGSGNNILHMAIENNNKEMVSYLLENTDVQLGHENFSKITPVHYARSLSYDNETSKVIFDFICDYIKEKGFEELMIKEEPEDEEHNSDYDELIIKSEPSSPGDMETEDSCLFSDDCISRLSPILNDTEILQALCKKFEFPPIGEISTKLFFSFANVTYIPVSDVREYLNEAGVTEAVNIIDEMC